jgi:hypothetical protein
LDYDALLFHFRCDRKNGQLVHAFIKHNPNVNQVWVISAGIPRRPHYTRDYAAAKKQER